MSQVTTVDPEDPTPLYLQAAAILRTRIETGKLTRRMPSIKDVEHEFGVAQGTAERALQVLKDEGLVRVVIGRGHWVVPPEQRPGA